MRTYKFIFILSILGRSCTSGIDPIADLTSVKDLNAVKDTLGHNIEKRATVSGAKAKNVLLLVKEALDVIAKALDKADKGEGKC